MRGTPWALKPENIEDNLQGIHVAGGTGGLGGFMGVPPVRQEAAPRDIENTTGGGVT